jgi:hypothetical protein
VWFATPLLQRTFTSYSLPVSRRTVSKDEGVRSVFAAIPGSSPGRALRDGRHSASQTRVNALMAPSSG